MNILFVLGNGFDLQVGLPTSYSDFYEYYKLRNSNSSAADDVKKMISDKPKEWSDLEVALGKCTSKFSAVSEYVSAYDDVQSALQEYILTVDKLMSNKAISLCTDKNSMNSAFRHPELYLSPESRYTLNGIYDSIKASSRGANIININAISFNYTHTVENFIGSIIGSTGLDTENIYFNRIQHVHREINENQSVWLGVDNEAQISNPEFRKDNNIIYRLVKPTIINAMSARLTNDTIDLIGNADVIVLFGASLGVTDMTWAKYIASAVSSGVPLICFVKNDRSYMSDNQKLIDQAHYKEEMAKKFHDYGVTISPNKADIFIEINSQIFSNRTENKHDDNREIVINTLLTNKSVIENI